MSKQTHGSFKSYVIGLVLSLVLTFLAYFIVSKEYFDGWRLIFILLELALVQLWVQMVFFLHLGREKSARWNITAFIYMAIIVLIIGVGSLWIMDNLHYSQDQHMSPEQTEEYIIKDEGY